MLKEPEAAAVAAFGQAKMRTSRKRRIYLVCPSGLVRSERKRKISAPRVTT